MKIRLTIRPETIATVMPPAVAFRPPVRTPRKPFSATASRTPLARVLPKPSSGTDAPAPAKILVSFVVLGVILGGIGLYEPLVKFAGAGASVPLLGFGNTLAKGVREAVAEKGFLGVLTGGLKATAGGITVAIVSGLIVSLIFKPRDKT